MVNETPVCPGCHFTCAIDDYQCARGEMFYERWKAGEEVPERRGPGRPPAGGMPKGILKPTSDERTMHLLHILEIALSDLERESGSDAPERRVVDCLMRHNQSASEFVITGRTNLAGAELGDALEQVEAQHLVERRQVQTGATFYALTDQGIEQAKAWLEELRAAQTRFLSVLDDSEKQQLHQLVAKLLEPGFARMRG